GYGNNSDLRTEITALGLTYVAGLLSSTTVWAPGTDPLLPKPWSGRGRPPKLMRRNRQHQPAAVKALAIGLPAKAWRTITWRQGAVPRGSQLRVRSVSDDLDMACRAPVRLARSKLDCRWHRRESAARCTQ
uniref:transposase n=1 Tax=Bradyrhizobium altum TaxID=1571202 RepID=UPI0035D917F9